MMNDGDKTKRKLCWVFLAVAVAFLAAFLALYFCHSSQLTPAAMLLLLLGYVCILIHIVFRVGDVVDERQRRLVLTLGIVGATCLLASFPLRQYLFVGWPKSIGADIFAFIGFACVIAYEVKYQSNKGRAN